MRAKSSLHPILEPFDLKGVGETGIRYLSPDRQDDTWLYLPSLRRVRRLSSAQRSDALFGQDTDVDSYGGYAGQIPWFDWKFLGEKEILASFHAEQFPVKYCEGGGDFIFCDTWEKRKVYVVEGTPKLPQYAYGKRLIFVDKETYLIAYTDIFDRSAAALEGVGQPVELQEARDAVVRHRVFGRDAVPAQHHDGRHAADARHEGGAAQRQVSRRAGLVLQPGRQRRPHGRVLHHRAPDRIRSLIRSLHSHHSENAEGMLRHPLCVLGSHSAGRAAADS